VRTDKLKEEYGVQYKWTVFPLHPDIPEAGLELSDLFAGRDIDLAAARKRMSAVAEREGLPFDPPSRTFNSRKAQELGKLAEKLGVIEQYQQVVYRAVFVEGRNIGVADELVGIAKGAGVPEDQARDALATGKFSKEVDDDWDRMRLLGISGVPAFVCHNRLLEGFQPYQHLVELIQAT
jgi:predicted DsbA family dithiol-disulfide isomerase